MTSKKLFNDLQRQHEHVSMMLPWFNSGKLNHTERLAVEQHLQICDLCRSEWGESKVLKGAFRVRKEQSQWQPPQGHFDQLLDRLDKVDAPRQTTSSVIHDSQPVFAKTDRDIDASSASNFGNSTNARQYSRIHSLMDKLRLLPSSLRWLFVVESVALAAFCLVFVVTEMKDRPSEDALYETLTSTSVIGVESHGLRVSLIFDEKMTEVEIRNLLKSTGGQMVSGPSDLGVYTVEIPVSQVAKAKIDDVLAVYRSNPKVRLLEPESINLTANPDERL